MTASRRKPLRACLAALVLAGPWVLAVGAQPGSCPVGTGWTQLTSPEPPGPPFALRSTIPWYSQHGAQNLAQRWDDSGIIYSGAPHGVYRSDDCGRAWSRLPYPRDNRPGFQTLETNPPDVNTTSPIYSFLPVAVDPSGTVYFSRTLSQFWASDDGGQTWRDSGFPLSIGLHLAFSRNGTIWLYGLLELRDQSPGPAAMVVSTNGGRSWSWLLARQYPPSVPIPEVFVADPLVETDLIIGREDGRLTQSSDWDRTEAEITRFPEPISGVAVSPDRQWMWVATVGPSLRVSKDEGRTWVAVVGLPDAIQRNGVHVLRGSRGDAVFVLTVHGELWFYRALSNRSLIAPVQIP